MTKVYNENILIKYLYDEATKDEATAVESVLKRNSRIRKEFRQLKTLKSNLNNLHMGPKVSVVNTILERSARNHWMWL
jgi:hypothetical protein